VEVYLFQNHPKSGSVYEPASKRLLPLDLAWQKQLAAAPWPTKLPPEVIEGTTSPLRAFIRGFARFACAQDPVSAPAASRIRHHGRYRS
jgi:F-type H+-transporting ATPase subunit gamma